MTYIIKNAKIVNPMGDGAKHITTLGIEEGCFSDNCSEGEIIDATGLIAIPGMIDMHAHLREPGQTQKEDIVSGLKAAAKGGFTSVCCMPNTSPVLDSEKLISYVKQRATEANGAKLFPIIAITKGSLGEELTDFESLMKAGAIAFSDDGRPVCGSQIMRHALELSEKTGALLISHAEDLELTDGGVMNEGEVSRRLGLPGFSRASEEVMTARDIVLKSIFGGRLHIAHVSTKGAIRLVADAKRAGIDITCETCPHYFTATDELIEEHGALAKVSPPLRTKEDVDAIKKALSDGTIDSIATDHAPHTAEEKSRGMMGAPCGLSGFETAFSLTYQLVEDGVISLQDMVKLTSTTPAKLLGIDGGIIKEGAPADMVLFDPNAEYELKEIVSKGKNTPFIGRKMRGKIMYTFVDGKLVYKG